MSDRTLTLREINRATLARQMLLERVTLPVPAAIERLAGLQAQSPRAPYVGLWTRLNSFQRDDLATLIDQRVVVKATLMRSTLHLVTTADYLRLRGALQPVLTSAYESISLRRDGGIDVKQILSAARPFIAEQPRSFAEISDMLEARMPDHDPGAMRYTVRTHIPLIQVPTDTRWSYPGNPKFTLAEDWLNQPIPADDHLRDLIFRYLAAFGPAAAADIQTWSGLGQLKDTLNRLRPDLVTYRDARKRELFDVPGAPVPDADVHAPPRFLPEFDNLLLAYKDRTRVVADAHRSKVYLPGLRVAATILIDGFVGGVWKTEQKKGAAVLTIEPFETLKPADRAALLAEGELLLRFVEPGAKTHNVRIVE